MLAVAEILGKSEVFAAAPRDALEEMAASAALTEYQSGQAIFEAGDPSDALYAVTKGRIRVYRTSEDGDEVTLALIEAGGVLGEIAVIDGGGRSASAIATTPTQLARISRTVFLRMLQGNPDIAVHVLKVVCGRLRNTINQLDSLAFLGLEARMARLLTTLAKSYGVAESDGVLIDLSIGQRELGAFIATSRESVSKQLAQWRDEGLVEKRGGKLFVRDLDALSERAAPEP